MVAEGVLAQRVRRFGGHEGGMAGGGEEVIEEEHGPQQGGVRAGEPALARDEGEAPFGGEVLLRASFTKRTSSRSRSE
jgi:hypothetical protein